MVSAAPRRPPATSSSVTITRVPGRLARPEGGGVGPPPGCSGPAGRGHPLGAPWPVGVKPPAQVPGARRPHTTRCGGSRPRRCPGRDDHRRRTEGIRDPFAVLAAAGSRTRDRPEARRRGCALVEFRATTCSCPTSMNGWATRPSVSSRAARPAARPAGTARTCELAEQGCVFPTQLHAREPQLSWMFSFSRRVPLWSNACPKPRVSATVQASGPSVRSPGVHNLCPESMSRIRRYPRVLRLPLTACWHGCANDTSKRTRPTPCDDQPPGGGMLWSRHLFTCLALANRPPRPDPTCGRPSQSGSNRTYCAPPQVNGPPDRRPPTNRPPRAANRQQSALQGFQGCPMRAAVLWSRCGPGTAATGKHGQARSSVRPGPLSRR
jgi:hypothetical protein